MQASNRFVHRTHATLYGNLRPYRLTFHALLIVRIGSTILPKREHFQSLDLLIYVLYATGLVNTPAIHSIDHTIVKYLSLGIECQARTRSINGPGRWPGLGRTVESRRIVEVSDGVPRNVTGAPVSGNTGQAAVCLGFRPALDRGPGRRRAAGSFSTVDYTNISIILK